MPLFAPLMQGRGAAGGQRTVAARPFAEVANPWADPQRERLGFPIGALDCLPVKIGDGDPQCQLFLAVQARNIGRVFQMKFMPPIGRDVIRKFYLDACLSGLIDVYVADGAAELLGKKMSGERRHNV